MWKNIVVWGRPQTTIWRMRNVCWIPKARSTLSQYVILIAFPLHQWLRERASTLHYAYIACLVVYKVGRLWDVIIVLLGMDAYNHIKLIVVRCTDAFTRTGLCFVVVVVVVEVAFVSVCCHHPRFATSWWQNPFPSFLFQVTLRHVLTSAPLNFECEGTSQ